MGKHSMDKADKDSGRFEGELPTGELKEQISKKAEPGDHVGDSSQSPIETW